MELNNRLRKIAELIPKGSVIADIGTDHAYVPVYCFINNITEHAIAMDVNEGPLLRAKSSLEKYGFEDKAELRLSNGLEKLSRGEADTIIIAGMGGLLITEIIKNGIDVIDDNTLLILQPMIAPIELREFLFENGFDISNEYVEREENKFYNIICAKRGVAVVDDIKRIVGTNIFENSPEVAPDYIDYKIRVCKKIIDGINKSECPDETLLKKYTHEISVYNSCKEVR